MHLARACARVCVCVWVCVWVCGCVGVWVCGCMYVHIMFSTCSHFAIKTPPQPSAIGRMNWKRRGQ